MQAYMEKFPQPADEAERRLVLLKKNLMGAPRADFGKVDDVIRNLLISGALGPCRCAMFNVIGEEHARSLSLCLQVRPLPPPYSTHPSTEPAHNQHCL